MTITRQTCKSDRLTSWVYRLSPVAIIRSVRFKTCKTRQTSWVFGCAQSPLYEVFVSKRVQISLTSWVFGFAQSPSQEIYALNDVNLDWHPGFFRLCPVAIRRNLRVKRVKVINWHPGFFGFAQSPLYEVFRFKTYTNSLTSWVFGFAQLPSEVIYAQKKNLHL